MIYDRLTDAALAERLVQVAGNVRALPAAERAAMLTEAAKRLQNQQAKLDEYKARVRERAISEAGRRGWCGEFDEIIRQLDMQGRWANYVVHYSYIDGTIRTDHKRVIARDVDHANQMVTRWFNSRVGGRGFRIVSSFADSYVGVEVEQAAIHENGEE